MSHCSVQMYSTVSKTDTIFLFNKIVFIFQAQVEEVRTEALFDWEHKCEYFTFSAKSEHTIWLESKWFLVSLTYLQYDKLP